MGSARGQRRRVGAGPVTRGWRATVTEVLLVTVVLAVFTRLHDAAGTAVAAATANAHRVQSLEQALHIDIELAMNRWLTGHGLLIAAAVLLYRLYYAVLVGVLIWVFVRHAEVYLHVRRTFVAMLALALLVFWAFPVSPPRFALNGVVDIIAEHDIVPGHPSTDLASGANHFSAMPSLHVGWCAWCAYAAWSALRGARPRTALLAWLFPLVMVVDVLMTGAHYALDVVGSAILLVAAIASATWWADLLDRRRTTES